MSVLPAEVQGALTQLLQALTTSDNTIRSQAEEQLNNDWTPNRPDMLLMGLVEQIQAAPEPAVCSALPARICLSKLISVHRHDPLPPFSFASSPQRHEKSLPLANPKSCFSP